MQLFLVIVPPKKNDCFHVSPICPILGAGLYHSTYFAGISGENERYGSTFSFYLVSENMWFRDR